MNAYRTRTLIIIGASTLGLFLSSIVCIAIVIPNAMKRGNATPPSAQTAFSEQVEVLEFTEARRRYLNMEGPANRSEQFQQLAVNVSAWLYNTDEEIAEHQIIELLGSPDRKRCHASGTQYAYAYTRIKKHDWVVLVDVSARSKVLSMSYCPASSRDWTGWESVEIVSGEQGVADAR